MSIRELEKNKKYKIEVIKGYDENSRKLRHSETFYGKKSEAKLREAEIKASIKNHTYVDNHNISFGEYFKKFIEYKKENWGIMTYENNKCRVRYIIEELGYYKLQNINVEILEAFYRKLKNEKKYGNKTIKEYYVLINEALKRAVLLGYIVINPNTRIEPPKIIHSEVECYSIEECKQLLEALEKENIKYKALITLALDSGARRSEIIALKWSDIDFDNKTMDINKSLGHTKELGTFEKPTKNKTSNRRIVLMDNTINVLKEYKKDQLQKQLKLGNKWNNPNDRVFTDSFGGDMGVDTPSQIFANIIKKHDLKKIKFHGLRHSSASLLIALKVQPQIISKRLGHSNISTTHMIYSHFFNNEFEEVANTMNNTLINKKVSSS